MCYELDKDFRIVVTKINETKDLTDIASLFVENDFDQNKLAYVSASADIPDGFTLPLNNEHILEAINEMRRKSVL